MHLLTFTSWIYPETHFSTTFKTISVYLARETSRISISSSQTMRNSLVHQDAKSTNQQNKCQNCIFFMEIPFQDDSYFTGTWTYLVRLPIPSMQLLRPVFRYKADNCNKCTKVVNNVLLY